MSKTNLKNSIEKIVVNTGIGRLASQSNFEEKILPEVVKEFSMITGQKPANRTVRQSIAGFKIREGAVVGLVTTLRGKRMVDFFEKLVNVVLPRIRDFRGITLTSVDSAGNLNIGIKDYLVFPEINQESSKVNFGVQVTAVLKRQMRNTEEAIELYRSLGVPLKKKK
jgi:large subunit ribosomal protein L5